MKQIRTWIYFFVLFFVPMHSLLAKESNVDQLFSASLEQLNKYRKTLSIWDMSVRGFRKEHNFAFSMGRVHGLWDLGRTGQLKQGKVPVEAYYARFQYSFHIQTYKSFGYYIGSSIGSVFFEKGDKYRTRLKSSTSLPGALLGLSLNLSSAIRLITGLDTYLERLESLSFEGRKVSVTARVYSAHAAIEFFFRLRWAIKLEANWRHLVYKEPRDLNSNSDLVGSIGKQDNWLGFGLTYHLI